MARACRPTRLPWIGAARLSCHPIKSVILLWLYCYQSGFRVIKSVTLSQPLEHTAVVRACRSTRPAPTAPPLQTRELTVAIASPNLSAIAFANPSKPPRPGDDPPSGRSAAGPQVRPSRRSDGRRSSSAETSGSRAAGAAASGRPRSRRAPPTRNTALARNALGPRGRGSDADSGRSNAG